MVNETFADGIQYVGSSARIAERYRAMKKEVIVIFDVGKTNKKMVLFDAGFRLVHDEEQAFDPIVDEDGVESDNVDEIARWMKSRLKDLVKGPEYSPVGLNFSTYGATIVLLDRSRRRLAPVYNYLKPVDPSVREKLFATYGGEEEFCRCTASPSLENLLNSGVQLMWLKEKKPALCRQLTTVLHLPQYFFFLFSGILTSEPTSVGCHTFMWDFEQMTYHRWLAREGFSLPVPRPNGKLTKVDFEGISLLAGAGIHDSSASLVPYCMKSKGPFVLISTGTWCINMNPFNEEPLTAAQLSQDCLCFLSTDQRPVKSSRFFMGYFHDHWVQRLALDYGVSESEFFRICEDPLLAGNAEDYSSDELVFFPNGGQDYRVDAVSFDPARLNSYQTAYSRLLFELTALCARSVRLVLAKNDSTRLLYVSGGFSRNRAFLHLLSGFFPDKEICCAEMANASALGAALVMAPELGWSVDRFSRPDKP